MGHKVFVSYSHNLDQDTADKFRDLFADQRDLFIDKSIREDIGDKQARTIKARLSTLIKDSTVTVVLIGKQTGGRSWIDWEIYHSLRKSEGNTRNGLLGIYIPYKEHWVPKRLEDNIPDMGLIVEWPRSSAELTRYIESAFEKRNGVPYLKDDLRERNSYR